MRRSQPDDKKGPEPIGEILSRLFAARGWGDLPEGTPIQWPVPYQEMDARAEPFYALGGVGQPGSAGPGNYGLKIGGLF